MSALPRRLALLACLITAPAAAEPLVLGMVAPVSGPSASLGNQVAAGARAAAALGGAERVQLVAVDDACTAAGGAQAAQRLVEAKVQAVVGFLCADAIAAAMPALGAAGIPVVAVGVRANSLTDERVRTGWTVARLSPRADGEREAAGRLMAERWRNVAFAILDDGTIYGRDLAESVRDAAETAGLKPAFTDTFRPGSENQVQLAERMARAGVKEVFVGGDRADVAVIARDAAVSAPGIVVIGGEALHDEPGEVALPAGTLSVNLAEAADRALQPVLDAVRAQGSVPEGYALPAYAAVEIALKALETNPVSFDGRTFGTATGPVSFDGRGDLAQNPFELFRFDGARFVPADAP